MRVRPERIAQLIRREIADILGNKLRDPRLSNMISVTDVEVTQDLSVARVYVSVLEAGEARTHALQALNRAARYVRHELSPRLGLREMPEIRFVYDRSIETGARVEELLRRIERGEPLDDETA